MRRAPCGQAERAEREAGQMRPCTPTTSEPSATGRQYQSRRRPKRARRQGKIEAGTDTPTSVQQLCTHVQSCDQKRPFLLGRAIAQPSAAPPPYGCGIPLAGTARFLFRKTEKKMGGGMGKPPTRLDSRVQWDAPRGRQAAALTASQGCSHQYSRWFSRPQRRLLLSRIWAFTASSSISVRTRSRIRILPLIMVVWHWRPVMPKSMWPSMLASEKGVKGL